MTLTPADLDAIAERVDALMAARLGKVQAKSREVDAPAPAKIRPKRATPPDAYAHVARLRRRKGITG